MIHNRQNSYDLLRIISAAAVVIIHINLAYYSLGFYTPLWFLHIIFDNYTRFCVPCFLMISGAFILNNSKNTDFKYFYKKVFFKTVLPFLLIAAFYFVFDICAALARGRDVVDVLKTYIIGREYNLWFMYFLVGIYALVPLVIRMKEKLGSRIFAVLTVFWTAASVVLMNLFKSKPSYSPLMIFSYMSFFLLGALLYGKLSNISHPSVLLIAALLFFSIKFVFRVLRIPLPIDNAVYFFPPTIIASVLIFLFFGAIDVKKPLKKEADKTYYIYLFHTFLYTHVLAVTGTVIIINPVFTVIILSAAVFAVSYIAAAIWIKMWKAISENRLKGNL